MKKTGIKDENRKRATILFVVALVLILILLAVSALKTQAFNSARHHAEFAGAGLFSAEGGPAGDVTVKAAPRSSTWGKIFDFDDEGIPFIARMICVADSFDAMNTNRVYRKKLTAERIIEEIETNKDKQFDPKVADVMLGLLRSGTIRMDS